MDFYEFLNLEKDLPSIKSHRYMFMKKFKDIGLPVENSVLFSCSYSSSVRGNMHFLWKEDKSYENHENLCQQLIDSINNSLPCFASSVHKTKEKITEFNYVRNNFSRTILSNISRVNW